MPAPDRYAVIGHPIAHSLSPRIHTLFAQQTRQTLSYVALDVLPEQLEAGVRDFLAQGGCGLNVTVPHKRSVVRLLDRLSERAKRAGAVNTVARQQGELFGDNTDGAGLVRDLTQNLGLSLRGRHILLLGAGGAARGILGPLLERSPAGLVIANRTHERASALAAAWRNCGPVHAVTVDELESTTLAAFDLIINATPPQGDASTLARLRPSMGTVCYDLAYGPRDSSFLHWARAAGAARVHDGLGMLIEQAADSFALWRGVRPDTAAVHSALSSACAAAQGP